MTIKPPRPAWNLGVLIMPLAPLCVLGWVLMGNEFAPDLSTKLHIVTLIFIFYAIMLIALYSFSPSCYAVISMWEYLQIHKKDKIITEHKLANIKEIISKYIKRNAERPQYEVSILKHSGEYDVLFTAEALFSRRQWDLFSEKLSSAIEKPLKIESWSENDDGKLLLISTSTGHLSQGRLTKIYSTFT